MSHQFIIKFAPVYMLVGRLGLCTLLRWWEIYLCPVNVPDCCTQPVPSTWRIMCPAHHKLQHNEQHSSAHYSTTIIQPSKPCITRAHPSTTIIQPGKACSTTDQHKTFIPPRWASKWPGKSQQEIAHTMHADHVNQMFVEESKLL